MIKNCVLPKALRYPLMAFYAYGAAVHVANIAGWTGFDWLAAPSKWQLLDVIYLTLDIGVFVGLLTNRWWAMLLLILAACSQIMLYTIFRSWVLDVPAAFQVEPEGAANLDSLVLFHVACLSGVGLVLWRAWITRMPA